MDAFPWAYLVDAPDPALALSASSVFACFSVSSCKSGKHQRDNWASAARQNAMALPALHPHFSFRRCDGDDKLEEISDFLMKWQSEVEEREAQVEAAEDVVCERLRQVFGSLVSSCPLKQNESA